MDGGSLQRTDKRKVGISCRDLRVYPSGIMRKRVQAVVADRTGLQQEHPRPCERQALTCLEVDLGLRLDQPEVIPQRAGTPVAVRSDWTP